MSEVTRRDIQALILELARERNAVNEEIERAHADAFPTYALGKSHGLNIALNRLSTLDRRLESDHPRQRPQEAPADKRERAVNELLEIAKLADDDAMRDQLEALASRFSYPPRATELQEDPAGKREPVPADEVRGILKGYGDPEEAK